MQHARATNFAGSPEYRQQMDHQNERALVAWFAEMHARTLHARRNARDFDSVRRSVRHSARWCGQGIRCGEQGVLRIETYCRILDRPSNPNNFFILGNDDVFWVFLMGNGLFRHWLKFALVFLIAKSHVTLKIKLIVTCQLTFMSFEFSV
jgi:hypothetical protein